jgi:hypothetical protein
MAAGSLRAELVVAVALVLLGLFYVGNAWSPSSAALALRAFDAPDRGLVAGVPQAVRADEWAVQTPLTQATVNNGFRRFNATSFYGEDLRIMYALPVFDWGLAFKPLMLGYTFLPPAYAFSLYHFLVAAVAILGYMRFFALCGARGRDRVWLGLCVVASGYAQTWWTIIGPLVAFFPWVVVAASATRGTMLGYAAYAWVAACWLLSYFYPPMIVSLAFVAALVLACFRGAEVRQRFAQLVAATAVAAGIACLYLADYLRETWDTLYPGRRASAGGGVDFDVWLSQFFPTMNIAADHAPTFSGNVCVIASAGSAYLALVVAFLDYRALRAPQAYAARVRALALAAGLALMWAWMLVPLPAWLGAPLLWNRVPPERMEFAAGLAALVLAFHLARACGLVPGVRRALALTAACLGVWVYAKLLRGFHAPEHWWLDLACVAVAWALVAWPRLRAAATPAAINTGAGAAAAALLLIAFGTYNPIQSAKPLFERAATPVTAELDRILAAQPPGGGLAVPGFFGATLNGWGYRAIPHVLATPKLATWAELFPELDAEERTRLFNRYAHIAVSDTDAVPQLVRFDAVSIPRTRWRDQVFFPRDAVILALPAPVPASVGGHVESATVVPARGTIRVTGWAPFDGWDRSQRLEVIADPAPKSIRYVGTVQRFDLGTAVRPRRELAGFALELGFAEGVDPGRLALCVISEDRGTRQVLAPGNGRDAIANCSALARAPEAR